MSDLISLLKLWLHTCKLCYVKHDNFTETGQSRQSTTYPAYNPSTVIVNRLCFMITGSLAHQVNVHWAAEAAAWHAEFERSDLKCIRSLWVVNRTYHSYKWDAIFGCWDLTNKVASISGGISLIHEDGIEKSLLMTIMVCITVCKC